MVVRSLATCRRAQPDRLCWVEMMSFSELWICMQTIIFMSGTLSGVCFNYLHLSVGSKRGFWPGDVGVGRMNWQCNPSLQEKPQERCMLNAEKKKEILLQLCVFHTHTHTQPQCRERRWNGGAWGCGVLRAFTGRVWCARVWGVCACVKGFQNHGQLTWNSSGVVSLYTVRTGWSLIHSPEDSRAKNNILSLFWFLTSVEFRGPNTRLYFCSYLQTSRFELNLLHHGGC